MNAASEDTKDLLVQESALTLIYANNLFISEMPDSPDECVCIYDTGGENSEPSYTYERPAIQVRVRGNKGKYQDAYDLATGIKNVLNGASTTINSARYIGIWSVGDVIFIAYDDNHRPLLSINFRAHRTDV